MQFNQILLVMNPKSGKQKLKKEKIKIVGVLEQYGKILSYITNGVCDKENIKTILNENKKVDLVVICGGDGTLNLALNALYSYKTLKYVFIPYGTINIFAKEHCYPKCKIKALEQILTNGKLKLIYPGFTENNAFILMKSIGFDSYLVKKVESKRKRWKALFYFFSFFVHMFKYNFKNRFDVVINDKKYSGNFVVISNCVKYGGFLKFSSQQSFTKDYFNIFIFNGKSLFSSLILFFKVLLQKHYKSKNVKILKSEKVKIEGVGYTQMDGDIGEPLPIEIFKKESVQFLVP